MMFLGQRFPKHFENPLYVLPYPWNSDAVVENKGTCTFNSMMYNFMHKTYSDFQQTLYKVNDVVLASNIPAYHFYWDGLYSEGIHFSLVVFRYPWPCIRFTIIM
jgi:hypothetical protein